ncbi:MAG: ammonium transporter [Armatimonadota bacterium]
MVRRWFSFQRLYTAGAVLLMVLAGCPAFAAESKIDSGDTAWILISTAVVWFMTPGLALFYGGLVRRKNVLGTMMQSFAAIGFVSIQWIVIGYTLTFGKGNLLIGGLRWIGLRGVGADPDPIGYASTVPHAAFMAFQMMFAIITAAILFGGVAERMKFKAYAVFILLWTTFVYDPLAHWVWGSGGLFGPGGIFAAIGLGPDAKALDFAGGLVVHMSSGMSALICALVLGRRLKYLEEPMPPHNLPLAGIGAGVLWLGWFGFNAGSALAANGLSAVAFLNTNTGAAAGILGWVFAEWLKTGKPTFLGAISGLVAGLVVITPACGFVEPWAAIIMGAVAGAVCYAAVSLKPRLGYDDSLDAFGVHCVGGTLGALFTGLFATTSVNPSGANGLFYGNPKQFLIQAVSVLVTYAAVTVACYALLMATKALVGLRVDKGAEIEGLDLTEHGEEAYNLGITPALGAVVSSTVHPVEHEAPEGSEAERADSPRTSQHETSTAAGA